MSIEKNIINLKEYIEEDEIYQKYKNKEETILSDFEMFCINHCKDIEIALGNLEALCDMQRSVDRELENARKINEEHQKINGELREKVRKLEKENSTLKNFTSDLFNEDITQTFICKDKIKDKIEELKQALENTNKDRWKAVYTVQIEILQALLQESEDK